MIDLFDSFKRSENKITIPTESDGGNKLSVSSELSFNLEYIKRKTDKNSDVIIRDLKIYKSDAALVFCDGLCNSQLVSEGIIKPLHSIEKLPLKSEEIAEYIVEESYSGAEVKTVTDLNDIFFPLYSGFCVLIVDKCKKAFLFGAQGFEKRSVDQPYTEVQEKGAMESFVETLTDNVALLHRRIKTPELKTEEIKIGSLGQPKVLICYLKGRADEKYVKNIKERLQNAKLDTVLNSDYLRAFLDTDFLSFFSAVGSTERPDVFASKLAEGRVGVMTDGSPFALYMPFLFSESFQSLDDYSYRPYYTFFIRILRILCFFISVMLPGVYVAVCVYHQEVLSQALLVEIAVQENVTPFSITVEALVVHIMYEIVREAGLRMPKAVGHAVSIVGALVIGEAAVTAGIIAAPMVIIVALTAIGSFVVSPLYEAVSVLRLLMIIIGGISGFFGIMLGFGVLVINICALNPYGVPYASTVVPLEKGTLRDGVIRESWKSLGKRVLSISKLEK